MDTKPELLAPAGSPEALDAAIAAGADAVYFGASAFNARMGAQNFDGSALDDAFRKCRAAGVRTNITLNTLVYDREMSDLLRTAERLYRLGADALIVADLGAARLIHRYFPDLCLHASTQAAGHNTLAAIELQKLGFSRMVAARELSFDDLSLLCRESPIETELFIHGAICVSQSGQCLLSSLIGGRSGNRGECAQPCRLPYRSENGKESYALSLKDMCLAGHITELLKLGAASLKIEGRMKSPEYVWGVTSIYRRLLDEERNANPDELAQLRALFSRSGFTDGYFTGKIGRGMLGVRTEADKSLSAANNTAENYARLASERRRDAELEADFRIGEPSRLTLSSGGIEVTESGPVPEAAKNCPLTAESAAKNLTKLGGTPFRAAKVQINVDEGVMLPVSALNALRRGAAQKLSERLDEELSRGRTSRLPDRLDPPSGIRPAAFGSARFNSPEQITPNRFEVVYLPLERYKAGSGANGVIIPPVIFDSGLDEVRKMLSDARSAGASHALVSNLGHIALAREAGMHIHGDFRLNIYNSYAIDALMELGFESLMASPELTLPQLRDLGLPAIVYGRVPLMVLEKCLIRDLYSCEECGRRGFLGLTDRRGVRFPLIRTWKHRNLLYNSVPIYMADRRPELERAGLTAGHFIFSTETAREAGEVLEAYRLGLGTDKKIRRINK